MLRLSNLPRKKNTRHQNISILSTNPTPPLSQPDIFITVGRGLLHTPTSITCLWTRDQDYGVIVLEAVATDLDVQTTMVAFKDDGQHGSFYPEVASIWHLPIRPLLCGIYHVIKIRIFGLFWNIYIYFLDFTIDYHAA